MPLALLRYGLRRKHQPWRIIPPTPKSLKKSYDVVIIGAGGHGLATAYYLAKTHRVKNVAVLDKGYLGGGNTARNTAIIRSNYLTPEGIRFYDAGLKLWQGLANELGINLMYSRRGHLTLAHNDASVRTMRWRAEVNKHLGVDSELVYPDEIARLCPQLNMSREVRYPVLAALHHPPGGIARHDAVAWGYGMRAAELGAEIHQKTEVTGVVVRGGRVHGVQTARGEVRAGKVVQAVAGYSSVVAKMAGFKVPIHTVPLQACVSEPVKPCLDKVVVSESLSVYVSQSARGELVIGGRADPYPLYRPRSTLDFKEDTIGNMLDLFPQFSSLHLMRQWAGLSDLTPDFSPIMGLTPVRNYYIDSGWGTWGFKATPISGVTMAETIVRDRPAELIEKFSMQRFDRFVQVSERGAAAVGH